MLSEVANNTSVKKVRGVFVHIYKLRRYRFREMVFDLKD